MTFLSPGAPCVLKLSRSWGDRRHLGHCGSLRVRPAQTSTMQRACTHPPIRRVGCQYFTGGFSTALCPNMRAHMLFFFYEPHRERKLHPTPTTEHLQAYFLRVRACLTASALSLTSRGVATPECCHHIHLPQLIIQVCDSVVTALWFLLSRTFSHPAFSNMGMLEEQNVCSAVG